MIFFLHVSFCLALYTNQKTSQKEKLIYFEQYSLSISVANSKLEDPGRVFSLKSPSDYSIFLAIICGYLIIRLQSAKSLNLMCLCNHRRLFCQFD